MTNDRSNDERLITDRELAKRWGWNTDTPSVLRARQTLPIPYVRLGKRIRYRLSDVLAYERQQTVRPAAVSI